MFRHWNHTLIAALAASSLMLQPVNAGVFQCATCCDSQTDESCCQRVTELSCCSKFEPTCCQSSRSSCCGVPERPTRCGCGERGESQSETPLSPPPTAEAVLDSLAMVGLTTWHVAVSQPERIAFEQSPVARSAPPAKQLMLCVWRT